MITSTDASTSISIPRDKIEGAFIALAAGDALGWPQESALRRHGRQQSQVTPEFRNWERRSGSRFYAHREIIRAGEYSDDTQLTMAVARSLVNAGAGWWVNFARCELPLWTLYQRGGGGATKRAAMSWVGGIAPWKQPNGDSVRRYFEAGGNGVAMRVLPHAVHYATDAEPAELLRDVLLDGATTHGHPRALVGATAYAYAAWWLLRTHRTIGFGELVSVLLDGVSDWGTLPSSSTTKNSWLEAAYRNLADYGKLWREVVAEMTKLLTQVREGLAAGSLADDDEVLSGLGAFGNFKGAGTISAAAAIYLTARHATQPLHGVLRAAFATGSDTDTIASMTGGLLGALAGTDWLPTAWFAVQDCAYLRELANRLAAQKPAAEGVPSPVIGSRELDAAMNYLLAGTPQPFDLGGGRYLRVLDFATPKAISRNTLAKRWHLEMFDGQTVYVTKVGRQAGGDEQPPGQQELPVESPRPRTLAPQKVEARAVGVKISVASLSASLAFYEGLLGLKVQCKTTQSVSFGAITLADDIYADQLSQGAVTLNDQARRNRVEIQVSNLDAVHAAIVERQIRIVAPISRTPVGERSVRCLDPDGNLVEIVERGRD